ncbi:hypothetical protein AMTRI_Chr05g59490 [Amborella trichopoda]
MVYAIEFSPRSGRGLLNMAKKRPSVIPIIEDADIHGNIGCLNTSFFLKSGGHFVMLIKANCMGSTVPAE